MKAMPGAMKHEAVPWPPDGGEDTNTIDTTRRAEYLGAVKPNQRGKRYRWYALSSAGRLEIPERMARVYNAD